MERKPGRPRALTVDLIAQAALDDGVDDFSMPSVARRLGVAHSGLYRYVTDRDDLLVQALERAYMSVEWPEGDQPWNDLIHRIGDAVWQACDAYPGLDRATQTAPRPAPGVLAKMDAWVNTMHAQHFLLEDAAVAVEFVIALALDCSNQMARLAKMERNDLRSSENVLKAYDTDEVWVGRGLYDRKLDIFLAGLSTRTLADSASSES